MVNRCAVFASGGGSNFQALLDHKKSGALHAEFVLFVGNNSKAKAFDRARENNIPTLHLAPSHFTDEGDYTKALLDALHKHQVQVIVLAGYMKKLPTPIIQEFRHRILNIHPSLLPAFGGQGMYGSRVHESVIGYGAKVTGVTVHFVNEEYDQGPIILQESIKVLDADNPHSLAERVLVLEHQSYWKALESVIQESVRVEGRRVLGNG